MLGSDHPLNARFLEARRLLRRMFGPFGRSSGRAYAPLQVRMLRWLSATRRAQFTAGLTCALLFGVFFGALIVADIRSRPTGQTEPVKRAGQAQRPIPVPVRLRVEEQPLPAQRATRRPEPSNGSAAPMGDVQASGDANPPAIPETPAVGQSPASSGIPESDPKSESAPRHIATAPDPAPTGATSTVAPSSVSADPPPIPAPEPAADEPPSPVGAASDRAAIKNFGPSMPDTPESRLHQPTTRQNPAEPPKLAPKSVQTAALTSDPSAIRDAPAANAISGPVDVPDAAPAEPGKADAPDTSPVSQEPVGAAPAAVASIDNAAALGSEVADARSAGAAKVVEPSLSAPPMPPLETPALIEAPAKAGDPPKRIAALPVPGGGQWLKNAVAMPPPTGRPMIAIVIDDVGINQRRTRRTIDLPAPLTLSFIPYGYNLRNLVASARKAGHEILVHIPMEPRDLKWNPGPNALLTSQNEAEILRRLRWGLDQFDGYVGVSNHMGSKFTAWRPGMTTVLREIRSRGLLFLDSWTSNRSLGFAMSREINIPSVARDIFIDHDISRGEIRDNLGRLERIARRRGFAIGIGHPHDLTTSILADWIGRVRLRGVDLVPISSIVRRRLGAG